MFNFRSTLMMVLQAQSGLLADSTDIGPTPSPLIPAPVLSADDLASQLAISKGQVYFKFCFSYHYSEKNMFFHYD
jgi:hypothetical protein